MPATFQAADGVVYAVGPQFARSRERLGSLRAVKSSANVLGRQKKGTPATMVPSPDQVGRAGQGRRQSMPSVPSWDETGSANLRRGTSWKTPRMEARDKAQSGEE